ncbi:MAG: hypothetical protein QG670_532 [Thermoproteota archaeon]|nr:hypothetical protein [Thermoproteota archaeon]
MVVVKWWGHACFEVRDSVIVVTDPHDGKSVGGMPVPHVKADIILVSHGHEDHASGKNFVTKSDSKILDKAGTNEVKGVKVKGVATFHDDAGGKKRGNNIVFVFEVDGIRFAHLGDLGHVLLDREAEEIKPIDVLMIPVGGYYTIDAVTATVVAGKLNPKIIIPMHYKVKGLDFPISDVEPFLKGKNNIKRLRKSEVTYSKMELPAKTEIDVFSLE